MTASNGTLQTWTVAGHLGSGLGHATAPPAQNGVLSATEQAFLHNLLTENLTSLRLDPLRRGTDPRRDVRAECGFPRSMPDALDFLRLYRQDAVAGVVVDRWPDECFKAPGEVWDKEDEGGDGPDTPFVAAVNALGGRMSVKEGESYYKEPEYSPLWRTLCDWDKASRVGRFGLLMIGLDDGLPLNFPAAGVEEEGSAPEGYAYDYLPDEYKSYPGDTNKYGTGPLFDRTRPSRNGAGVNGDTVDDHGYPTNEHGDDNYDPNPPPRYRGWKVRFKLNKDGGTTPTYNARGTKQTAREKARVLRVKENGAPYRLTVNREAQDAAYAHLTTNVYGTPPTADSKDAPTVPPATSDTTDPPPTEAPKSVERLLYCKVFTEASVTAVRWERNRNSPRYGKPTHYFIDFGDPLNDGKHVGPRDTAEVHWTRVLVLPSDARLAHSEHEGVPACWPVWPEIYNLQKVSGAGAEGFYTTGIPMLALTTPPAISGMPNVRFNVGTIRAELEKMRNSTDKSGVFRELQPQLLSPSMTDPTPYEESNYKKIAAALNMPIRKLLGSERGDLASSQDEGDHNDATRGRRLRRTIPDQLVPLVDRLILLGVLPEPEGKAFKCGWPDDDALSAQERTAVFLSDMTALGTYVEKGIDAVMDPETMSVKYLDQTPAEARQMLDAATQANADRVSTEQDQEMQGQKAKIDAGLAPDPAAAPPPNTEPITVKQGDKVIAHPNATPPGLRPKVLAANPAPKPAKPKLNGKRKAVKK